MTELKIRLSQATIEFELPMKENGEHARIKDEIAFTHLIMEHPDAESITYFGTGGCYIIDFRCPVGNISIDPIKYVQKAAESIGLE